MPKAKDLKRLVRARMRKTGEAYTAARTQLLKKKAPPSPPVDYAKLAGMSDSAVHAKTGRTWKEWVATLDAVGASEWPHGRIADHVHEEHGVPGWWTQTVTVGYERIRGLRDVGQRRGGGYEANKSKTCAVPLAVLYRAWSDPAVRRRWWPGPAVTFRPITAEKSMAITWTDGTRVDLRFSAKPGDKSRVTIQHPGIAGKATAVELKEKWAEIVAALETHLNTSS